MIIVLQKLSVKLKLKITEYAVQKKITKYKHIFEM